MKKNLFIATAAFLLAAGTAQSAQAHSENAVAPSPTPDAVMLPSAPDDQPIYNKVDVMAEFPGGAAKLMEFLMKNMKFPQEALKEKVDGRVMVQFVVETDGSLTQAKVVKSLHPACDAEALRVIKQMPRWTPAKVKGKMVRSRFTIPVLFRNR